LVNQAILVVERNGPAEGRPLVDSITASRITKELSPPSTGRSEIRILFCFDPWALGDPAHRRRQVRPMEPLVPPRHPRGRRALYDTSLTEREKEINDEQR